ncbi:hypothetical protein LTR39_002066 [Cryomyces antarcticus]|nr:hypothetical protein LTR39_002066 [Cryomyces antarcticus]
MAAPRSDWSGDDGLFRRRHPHEKFSGPTDGSVETANLLPNTPELRGQSLRLLDYEYDCQGRVSTCPKGQPRGHTLDDIAARLAVADSEDFQEAVNRATGGDDVDWTWNKNSFAKSPPETRVPNASPASHMRWPHELETSNSSNKANLSRTEHEHTVDTNMREIRRPWLSDEGLSSETCNDNRVSPNKSILSPMSETWTGDEEFYHSSATAESRPKTQTVPSWLKRIAGRQKHSSLFPGGLWRHDSVTCQTRPAFKAVVQDENLMHNDVNNDDASYRSSTGEDIYSALLENLSSPSSSYEGYSSPSPVRRHNTLCETSSRGVDGDEISLAPPELEPRRRSFPSLQCLPQASRVLGTHRGVNTLSEALIGHQETKQVHSRLHATPNFVQIIRKASNETADDDNDYVVHTHKSEPWTTESSEPQIIIGASSGGTAYDADWEDASPYRAPDTAHGQISTIPDISSSKSLIASRTTYGQLSRLSTAFSRTLGTPIRNECTVSTRHCSTDGEEEFLSAEESHAPALLSRPTRTFQRKTGMTRLKCSPAAPTLRGDMHGRCREYNTASTMCGRSSHTTMEDLERFNPNVHDADGPELPWCTDNARLRLNAEQRKQLYASANAALEARGKQPYHTMTQESLRFTKADAVVTTIHDELPDGYEPHVSLSSLSGKPIAIELSSREGNKDLDTRATPTGIATSCTFSGDPTWGAALRDLRGDFATPAVAANPPSSPRPNGLAACINGRQRPVDRDESTFTFGERYLVGTANPHSKSRAVAAPSGHKAQSASSAPWHPASSSTAPPAPAPSADAAQHPYTVRSITAATRRALHDNSASAANGAADRRAAHAKAHHGNGGDADDDDDDDTPLSPLSPDVELHRGS